MFIKNDYGIKITKNGNVSVATITKLVWIGGVSTPQGEGVEVYLSTGKILFSEKSKVPKEIILEAIKELLFAK